MNVNIIRLLFIGLLVGINVQAEGISQLSLTGDLMIHPDQLGSLFAETTKDLSRAPSWSWPELSFAQPYHTAWSGVQAMGPFQFAVTSSNFARQELGVELLWDTPSISVQKFSINDTIFKTVNGVDIILHLVGQCTGMKVVLPSGKWKAKGTLAWLWQNGHLSVNWRDFQFETGASLAVVDLGQCMGPSGLRPALQQALDSILRDPSTLKNLIQSSLLNGVQSSLNQVESQLMMARSVTLTSGLEMFWQPRSLSGLKGGLVRVDGQFLLQKAAAGKPFISEIPATVTDVDLSQVTRSEFVLPKNTLSALLRFLSKTGDLQYQVSSDQIPAFTDLMQNSLLQFFVWPDLMSFASNTLFYFYVNAASAPSLSHGVILDGGGVAYQVSVPLLINQTAPAGSDYLPYVDFTSVVSGRLQAMIKNRNLVLSLAASGSELQANFRREFQTYRQVNPCIATSLLGSGVENFIKKSSLSIPVPQWKLSDAVSLSIVDVQQWNRSFRLPVDVVGKP